MFCNNNDGEIVENQGNQVNESILRGMIPLALPFRTSAKGE